MDKYSMWIWIGFRWLRIKLNKDVNRHGQFDVFSTVHRIIGLFLQPTLMHNAITHVCHITILDMFRALTCPSSGGTNTQTQHLVSSLL